MRPAALLVRRSAIAFALSALGAFAPAGAEEPDAETARRLAALTAERDELSRRVAEQAAWLEAAAEEQRALLARLRSLAGDGAGPEGADAPDGSRQGIGTGAGEVAALRGELEGLGAELEASRGQSRELSERLASSESDRELLAARVGELTAELEAGREALERFRAEGVIWATTTAAVNLRSGPGTGHRRLVTLPVGTRLELTGRGEGWARVRAAGHEGWVAAEYLRAESDEIGALRARISALEGGLAAARRAAAAATAQLEAARRQQTAGAGRQRAVAAERDELAERVRRLETEGRERASRTAELERQLTEASEEQARLASRLGELAARNAALDSANAALEASRRELAAELESARGEIARGERQGAARNEALGARLRAAETTAAELRAWLESMQAETAAPAPLGDVRAALEAWAAAWSARRADEFLSAYADGFRPPNGLSRAAWEQQARDRLARASAISMALDGLEVLPLGSGRVEASFAQVFESDGGREAVRKVLTMVREGAGWKIAAEVAAE